MTNKENTLEEWYTEFERLSKKHGWCATGNAEDYRENYEEGLTPMDTLNDEYNYGR